MADWMNDSEPDFMGAGRSAWDKGAALGKAVSDFGTRFILGQQTLDDKRQQLGMASALLQQMQQEQNLEIGRVKLTEAVKDLAEWENESESVSKWAALPTPQRLETPAPVVRSSKGLDFVQKIKQADEVYDLKVQQQRNQFEMLKSRNATTAKAVEFERAMGQEDPEIEAQIRGLEDGGKNPDGTWSAEAYRILNEARVAAGKPKFGMTAAELSTARATDKAKAEAEAAKAVPQTMDIGGGKTAIWIPGSKTLHVVEAEGEKLRPMTTTEMQRIAKDLPDDDPRKNQIEGFLADKAASQTKPGVKPATASTVPPPAQRKVGQTVTTDKGTFRWNGKGWEPVK